MFEKTVGKYGLINPKAFEIAYYTDALNLLIREAVQNKEESITLYATDNYDLCRFIFKYSLDKDVFIGCSVRYSVDDNGQIIWVSVEW